MSTPTRRHLAAFDPLSVERQRQIVTSSLLDEDDDAPTDTENPSSQPVLYLEMEEEPSRKVSRSQKNEQTPWISPERPSSPYEPITTSSGLLLTHRRSSAEAKQDKRELYSKLHDVAIDDEDDDDGRDNRKRYMPTTLFGTGGLSRTLYRERFELDNQYGHTPSSVWNQTLRLLSYARLGVAASACVLLIGMFVIVKHIGLEGSAPQQEQNTLDRVQFLPIENAPFMQEHIVARDGTGGQIVFLPLPEGGPEALQAPKLVGFQYPEVSPDMRNRDYRRGHRRLMEGIRDSFDSWMQQHGKRYRSNVEKERRFLIWSRNRRRAERKNERHGPCNLTGQTVFGVNGLSDLTSKEFKEQYLTGYTGPKADKEPRLGSSGVLGPNIKPRRHPEVHRRLETMWQEAGELRTDSGYFGTECDWYDVSCFLQYIFETYLYGIGKTMEPAYDANSYPTAVDWRNIGAVSAVRAQGSCGACWAITAVETIESAIFIATGRLYTLSETEIILCATECEMCAGGWPQEAIDYVVQHKGVPLRDDVPYNSDWLLKISNVKAGTSDELNANTVSGYMSEMCPSGGNNKNNNNHGSHSGDHRQVSESSSGGYQRYGGEISGYGYATKKCVCYTDGTGCRCDSQNESMAVRNVATYGPAVVCFDASTWQDYQSGIITSASGCSQGFMDVNHCAQIVGYAYAASNGEQGHNSRDNKSHDNKNGNSRDDAGSRSGYWIVRNQWSTYWGMNGYAYVAMGENTCGILNDMVIAYT